MQFPPSSSQVQCLWIHHEPIRLEQPLVSGSEHPLANQNWFLVLHAGDSIVVEGGRQGRRLTMETCTAPLALRKCGGLRPTQRSTTSTKISDAGGGGLLLLDSSVLRSVTTEISGRLPLPVSADDTCHGGGHSWVVSVPSPGDSRPVPSLPSPTSRITLG